jgi:nickel transport protein
MNNQTICGVNRLHWGRWSVILAAFVALSLVPAGSARAHKFFVSAWVEGDTVYLEAAFGDGSLAHNAEVLVFDDKDNRLMAAATNEQGEYSFKIPRKTALKIRVKAGMGHQDEVVIPLDEVEAALASDAPAAGAPPSAAGGSTDPPAAAPAGDSCITAAEMQEMIDTSLEKKLRPIVRKLATDDGGGPDFKDIAGGIGYILGLVGVGTYFNYRRKSA